MVYMETITPKNFMEMQPQPVFNILITDVNLIKTALLYVKLASKNQALFSEGFVLYQSHFLGCNDRLCTISYTDGAQQDTHFIGYLLVRQALGYEL